jgi:hypothetical protein
MSNSKISALTSATTPLAGTEVLPVVQSGATVKVTVANLTAGRAVSAGSLTLTGSPLSATSGGTGSSSAFTTNGIPHATSTTALATDETLTWDGVTLQIANSGYAARSFKWLPNTSDTAYYTTATDNINAGFAVSKVEFGFATTTITWHDGHLVNSTGNYVPNVAGRGINFTANTPAAGMTSQLLNWYEEGTWTPNQGAGLTLIGAFSSTGKYTRVGRNVTVSGTVTGATSVAVAAAGIITTNLPFTVGTTGHGNVTNAALTSFAAIICTSTNVTSAGAIAATGTLTFSATYFV